MASLMNFRKDMNLPAQAHELVMSRIPRIRRRPGTSRHRPAWRWRPAPLHPPHWPTGRWGQHERGPALRCELAVVPADH